MRAEVISIGDEMICGARIDTNAAWLSRRLTDLGIDVRFHTTVGDTLSDNLEVFRVATQRAELVVATGGLGPTRDDLTRDALAALTGQPLEFRQSAMDHIESLFALRNREMPQRNRVQAMFPVGSAEIFNPQGTAPGIEVLVPRADGSTSRIFTLPGVPAEMKRMFDETVTPRIIDDLGSNRVIRQHVMKLFGLGESEMEHRLGDMISRDRQPRVGITVSSATISLRISAISDSEAGCEAMIEATRREVLEKVPEYYFGDGEEFEQHHAIEQALGRRGESLVVVELGYAALLGNLLAALGNVDTIRGSLALADAQALMMQTDTESIEQAVAVVKRRFQADWLLLIDAYPLATATAVERNPTSTVAVTISPPTGGLVSTQRVVGGHPDILHPIIAKAAMAKLRKTLRQT